MSNHDWTNRFAVIGADVGAEEQKELEERRRVEERRKLVALRKREAEYERKQMAEIKANNEVARRQVEEHGEVVDTDLANCYHMEGLYHRNVM